MMQKNFVQPEKVTVVAKNIIDFIQTKPVMPHRFINPFLQFPLMMQWKTNAFLEKMNVDRLIRHLKKYICKPVVRAFTDPGSFAIRIAVFKTLHSSEFLEKE